MTEAEQERAAIVAWLREKALLAVRSDALAELPAIARSIAKMLSVYADAIERGDHLALTHRGEGR